MKAEVTPVTTRTVTLTMTEREARVLASILVNTVWFNDSEAGDIAENFYDVVRAQLGSIPGCEVKYLRDTDLFRVEVLG